MNRSDTGRVDEGDPLDPVLDRLLERHTGLRTALAELHDAALATVDNDLLDVCRARIATLIDIEPTGATADRPRTERERVCVELAEQWVLDVAAITDRQVSAVAEQLGDDGAVSFLQALLAVEQRLRMCAMWTRLGLVTT